MVKVRDRHVWLRGVACAAGKRRGGAHFEIKFRRTSAVNQKTARQAALGIHANTTDTRNVLLGWVKVLHLSVHIFSCRVGESPVDCRFRAVAWVPLRPESGIWMWTWKRPRPVDLSQLVTATKRAYVENGQRRRLSRNTATNSATKAATGLNTGNHGTSVRTLTLTLTSVHLSSTPPCFPREANRRQMHHPRRPRAGNQA